MARALGSLIFYLMISTYGISLVFAQDVDQFLHYDFSKANLSLDGLAAILPKGILQLTNETSQEVGHAFYQTPIEFNTSSYSFSTEFAFALVPKYRNVGQGITFVVSPTTDFRYAGPNSYFGLVNLTSNDKTENHIFAIELDTFRGLDAADISDNHVGIDVNGVFSIEAAEAAYFDVTEGVNKSLVLASGKVIMIWIDYDGINRLLNVTLAPFPTTKPNSTFLSTSIKPSMPLLSRSINLSEIFLERMFVGFSGSTGTITSNQYILGWSFRKGLKAESLDLSMIGEPPTPPPPPLKSKPLLTVGQVIIISTISAIVFLIILAVVLYVYLGQLVMISTISTIAFLVLLAFVLYVFLGQVILIPTASSYTVFLMILAVVLYRYHKKKYAEVLEEWEKQYSPQRFSFQALYKATKGFKESQLLGAGGFGKVYRGELPLGNQIAVKRVSHDAEEGMQQYVAEIASMGRLRHKNLVQLLGYCRRKGELLLVYECMPNGSLDDYLFNSNNLISLSWPQRVHIIKGVASALQYLHEEWEQIVLHRDIKASNILLDANLNGRLGDFGCARFYDRGMTLADTRMVGTIGYMAPELTAMGMATTQTDVYAFGAFMLEVVCGRRPVDPERPREQMVLVKWIANCGARGALMDTVDCKLEGNFEAEEAILLLNLGMICSQSNPEERPSMRQILQYLEGNAIAPEVSFDTEEFGNDVATTLKTTPSSASYTLDTVTVLFDGR